nr:hypothetical protein [uncultured bacterium]
MKVIDLKEAQAHLELYAKECQSSPVVVTVDGKPTFEMLPVRGDDADFVDRLLDENPAFRELSEDRRRQSDAGNVVSLEELRRRLGPTAEK